MARLTSTERHGLLLTGILMALTALLAAFCSRSSRSVPLAPQIDTVYVDPPAAEKSGPAPAPKPKRAKKARRPRPAPPERDMLNENF